VDIDTVVRALREWDEMYLADACVSVPMGCEKYCKDKDCIVVQAVYLIESLQAQLADEKRRERAAVECLERAMYTATTNHYDVDLCCMYCKYGPEGTCEGESTVLVGNPADGQEYDWDCRRCNGVSVNERGGWVFDFDRWRGPQSGEGERDE
jgi:hypothetical protein